MGFFKKLLKKKETVSLEGKPTIEEYLGSAGDDGEEIGIKEAGNENPQVIPAARMKSREDCRDYVKSSRQQQAEAKRCLSEIKEEYNRVGSILNDVQRIGEIADSDKLTLLSAALRIEEIAKERKQFQSAESKISEKQYQRMEEYGEDIRQMMAQLDEDEKYAQVLKQDMRHLEAEKTTIRYEKDELSAKKIIAKKAVEWSLVLMGISIVFYVVCVALLQENYDMFLYVMLGIVGVLLTGTFLLYQQSVKALRLADRKLNKAISMLNKVKAKYVNVVNSIQYQYGKYEVSSAYELNHIWGLYLEEKKNRERYRASSDQLHEAETTVIGILTEYFVEQPRFWVGYASALLDAREMVEVRHDLNGRRQKLRGTMESYRGVLEQAEAEMKRLAALNPEFAGDIFREMD